MKPIAIVGAGAVTVSGLEWRGLGARTLHHEIEASRSKQLAASHPDTFGFEVPAFDPADDVDAKSRKMMSPGARLAAIAIRRALADARWTGTREKIGFYLGVGASGGSMEELTAMLGASLEGPEFSLGRFGNQGLRACNPLFAFQLMNNFTLCHAAILEGLAGPNAAFFSRGTGTVSVIAEAAWAIESGECDRALAGGADSAHNPVTFAELVRDGFDVHPAEGAALLALERDPASQPIGWLTHAAAANARDGVAAALDRLLEARPVSSPLAMLSGWKSEAAGPLRSAAARIGADKIIDVTKWMGSSLAAGPAIATLAALDLAHGATEPIEVPVLVHGVEGDVGLIVVSNRERPPA